MDRPLVPVQRAWRNVIDTVLRCRDRAEIRNWRVSHQRKPEGIEEREPEP